MPPASDIAAPISSIRPTVGRRRGGGHLSSGGCGIVSIFVPDRRILTTGGAGFIGSSLALELADRHPAWEVVACDNLYRRGSELNLPRLRAGGVTFLHADVRQPADLERAGAFDALVECSAEPSVMASVQGDADYVVATNLVGAHHCLELAARHGAQVVFLSTSRVYPVAALEGLAYTEGAKRFELAAQQPVAGASERGIAEDFPLDGARTLYGASKLAAELLVTEYAASHGLDTGCTFNVGGGLSGSLSLRETTAICQELTGSTTEPGSDPQTRAGDVPVYISDCSALYAHTEWRPRRGPRETLEDICRWIRDHEDLVSAALA